MAAPRSPNEIPADRREWLYGFIIKVQLIELRSIKHRAANRSGMRRASPGLRRRSGPEREGIMLKKAAVVVLVFAFAFLGIALRQLAAADGQALFANMGCGACHKPDRKALGAALKDIAKTYKAEEDVVKFFKGDSKPLLTPETPPSMEEMLANLQTLPEEEQKAIASYIMSQK
jgi:cytochrome c551/c552